MTSRDFYNVKVVNDVIYNENTHVVSIFKDYLIYDDVSEFLKRSYKTSEARTRLPKIFEFNDKYSKVFPNYVVLPESKYMFKNIERKQRMIDEKQRCLLEMQQSKKKKHSMPAATPRPPETQHAPTDIYGALRGQIQNA